MVEAGRKILCKTIKKKQKHFLRIFSNFCDCHFEASQNGHFRRFDGNERLKTAFTKYRLGFTLLAVPFPAKTNTDAILLSATDIIKTGGITALSMRTLAGRLGVRASSLYRHFPDRSSIEKTLAVRAADQMLATMQQSIAGLSGERAVFAASRAYLDFATAEPAFYDLIIQSLKALPPSSESTEQISDLLLRVMSDATGFQQDAAGASALWSFLHGFTVLVRAGQVEDSASKIAFTRGTQALIRGLCVQQAEAARSTS